jgi:hypothetical protein
MLFELFDLKGHRRLRHAQLFGRARKAQLPGDGIENLQSAVGH